MNLDKYIGREVEIVYMDQKHRITQRKIRINAVADGKVRAFDEKRKAPRCFTADRVLAAMPVITSHLMRNTKTALEFKGKAL